MTLMAKICSFTLITLNLNKAVKEKAGFIGNNRPITSYKLAIHTSSSLLSLVQTQLQPFYQIYIFLNTSSRFVWQPVLGDSRKVINSYKVFPIREISTDAKETIQLICISHRNSAVMLPPMENFTDLTFAIWPIRLQLWKQDLHMHLWSADKTPYFLLDLC